MLHHIDAKSLCIRYCHIKVMGTLVEMMGKTSNSSHLILYTVISPIPN